MQERSPHFLLFSEAVGESKRPDRWRFVLQSIGGQQHLAAEDREPGTSATRLELLAVVRGLEALDQPSRVTLVTRSNYVARGIRRGLTQWRARRWRWEHFGQLVPIRDYDLWQRVDRAMQYHDVDCCGWHASAAGLEQAADMQLADTTPAAREAAAEPVRLPESAEPVHESKVAACQSTDPVTGPALLIVERNPHRSHSSRHSHESALTQALGKLRQNVFAPLAAFCRPAFTRAA